MALYVCAGGYDGTVCGFDVEWDGAVEDNPTETSTELELRFGYTAHLALRLPQLPTTLPMDLLLPRTQNRRGRKNRKH